MPETHKPNIIYRNRRAGAPCGWIAELLILILYWEAPELWNILACDILPL